MSSADETPPALQEETGSRELRADRDSWRRTAEKLQGELNDLRASLPTGGGDGERPVCEGDGSYSVLAPCTTHDRDCACNGPRVAVDPCGACNGSGKYDADAIRHQLRDAAVPASSSSGDRPSVQHLEEVEAALKRPEVRIVSPETDQAFTLDAVYSEPDIEDPDKPVTVVHLLPSSSGESGDA